MKRRINPIIVSMAFAIIFFAGSAHSEEYICRVSVGAITLDNVRIDSALQIREGCSIGRNGFTG